MKYKSYIFLLTCVAIINFIPVVGLFSIETMTQSYGISISHNEVGLLMQHRALLFGMIGGFVFTALFIPKLQTAAIMMAASSMTGFLLLVWYHFPLNSQLMNVAKADGIGLLLLILAISIKPKLQ